MVILIFVAVGKGETMRLIDADELGIGMCNPDVFPGENMLYAKGWNQAIKLLQNAPTINAVEVVRCKDCKWYKHYEDYNFCDNYTSLMDNVSDETFCCYGERRDNDGRRPD